MRWARFVLHCWCPLSLAISPPLDRRLGRFATRAGSRYGQSSILLGGLYRLFSAASGSAGILAADPRSSRCCVWPWFCSVLVGDPAIGYTVLSAQGWASQRDEITIVLCGSKRACATAWRWAQCCSAAALLVHACCRSLLFSSDAVECLRRIGAVVIASEG